MCAASCRRDGGYDEVFLDEGDMHMQDVVEALHAVNYQGAIDFDHVRQLTGDTANGRQYIAYSVGYVRALLQWPRARIGETERENGAHANACEVQQTGVGRYLQLAECKSASILRQAQDRQAQHERSGVRTGCSQHQWMRPASRSP